MRITTALQRNIDDRAANVGILVFIFMTLISTLSPAVHANDSFDYQLKLAKQGNAEAQFKVGEMYEAGIGVKQDNREALYWTIRAANQKHEKAGFKILYWDMERKGLDEENKAELERLNTKAKQGNPHAQYYLGKMYTYGIGINKNPDVAIDWLSKAASAGVLEAEIELASVMEGKQRESQGGLEFKSDPCSGKTARFLSTCK